MGGVVCAIRVLATIQVKAVPTDPQQLPAFDVKLRQIFSDYDIDQSIVNETEDADAVCEIMGKANWGTGERQRLWHVLTKICGDYLT